MSRTCARLILSFGFGSCGFSFREFLLNQITEKKEIWNFMTLELTKQQLQEQFFFICSILFHFHAFTKVGSLIIVIFSLLSVCFFTLRCETTVFNEGCKFEKGVFCNSYKYSHKYAVMWAWEIVRVKIIYATRDKLWMFAAKCSVFS